MIINGVEIAHTNQIESFTVRYVDDGIAARVCVRFHDGRKMTEEFVGEAETMCDAIALGVNAIVAYAQAHN